MADKFSVGLQNGLPLYMQIYDALKNMILSEEIKPGERIETEDQLAKRFNVSRITVRKAVSKLAEERIVTRTPKIGTIVSYNNQYTQGNVVPLKNHKSIGVVLPTISDTYCTHILEGIERIANERNYRLLLQSTGSTGLNTEKDELSVMQLIDSGVDGIVFYPSNCAPTEFPPSLDRAGELGIQIITVDKYFTARHWDYVVAHDFGSGYTATMHLWSLGHRRIMLIAADTHVTSMRDRILGYEQALLNYNSRIEEDLIITLEDGYAEADNISFIKEKLRQLKPDAVFALSDGYALMAMEAAQGLSLKIPDDLALVGFGNYSPAESLGLTTIDHPGTDIGLTAANILLNKIEGKSVLSSRIAIPTHLIIRDTCGGRSR